MNSALKVSSLLAIAWVALDAAPASADVRDHRTEARPVSSEPPPPMYRRRRGPRFMVPLKIDIGAAGASTREGMLGGVELRAGIHWASLSPKPTNTDIGIGVFGAAFAGPEDGDGMDDNNDLVYGGAYLEVAQTLSHGDFWRTWAGGRDEYLGSNAFGENHVGFGAAGRVAAELYISGVGIEPRGLFLGTYAVGVYAEVGARSLGAGGTPLGMSAGLTFRTPLVFMP